jgi:predicted NUDIX family NTP pyrophosphohydrolase
VPPTSAGLLLYRRPTKGVEVFLIHPGGPYWARKDDGAWSVPKGLVDPGERDLGIFRQPSGKRLHVWAIEGDCDPSALKSNLFEMEWPPRSGQRAQFPEVDRGGWFDHTQALVKITSGQRPLLERFYAEFA